MKRASSQKRDQRKKRHPCPNTHGLHSRSDTDLPLSKAANSQQRLRGSYNCLAVAALSPGEASEWNIVFRQWMVNALPLFTPLHLKWLQLADWACSECPAPLCPVCVSVKRSPEHAPGKLSPACVFVYFCVRGSEAQLAFWARLCISCKFFAKSSPCRFSYLPSRWVKRQQFLGTRCVESVLCLLVVPSAPLPWRPSPALAQGPYLVEVPAISILTSHAKQLWRTSVLWVRRGPVASLSHYGCTIGTLTRECKRKGKILHGGTKIDSSVCAALWTQQSVTTLR